MFPQNSLVKAIHKLYTDTCKIYERVDTKVNGVVTFKEALVNTSKCRISFKNIEVTSGDINKALKQSVVLFLPADITIKNGSRIVVNRNGVETVYANSGVPAIYKSHIEVPLEIFKGWA